VFAFGFTSNMIKDGSLTVEEASKKLTETLKLKRITDYETIIFVAHSMGGLVVLHNLLHEGAAELMDRVPVVVLLGTPSAGAQIADIAAKVANNGALANMFGADKNRYLQQLSDDWKRDKDHRPEVVCGYEKLPTKGVMIVPWVSANYLCSKEAPAIEGADHITMVKPDRRDHASVVLAVNALNDYAFVDTAAKLDYPDFSVEGGELTLWLASAQQTARIANVGPRRASYTIRQISDPKLYINPDDTPKVLEKNTTTKILISLLAGAARSEYSFMVGDDESARKVRVRIRDESALSRELDRRVEGVVNAVNGRLSQEDVAMRVSALPTGSGAAAEIVARAAFDAILPNESELPQSARWLLAADALAAAQLTQPARAALRKAEDASPTIAVTLAAQTLGGRVAAATGDDKLFRTATTPSVPVDVRFWAAGSATPQLASAERLATTLKKFPALESSGLTLQGDVAAARGNQAAARDAYRNAIRLDSSPANSTRLQQVSEQGAKTELRVDRAGGAGIVERPGVGSRIDRGVRRDQ